MRLRKRSLVGREPLTNAWESATDEQRTAAVEHERQCEQREQALLADYRAGRITADEFLERVATDPPLTPRTERPSMPSTWTRQRSSAELVAELLEQAGGDSRWRIVESELHGQTVYEHTLVVGDGCCSRRETAEKVLDHWKDVLAEIRSRLVVGDVAGRKVWSEPSSDRLTGK